MLREEVPPTISKPVLGWLSKEQISKLSNDQALEIGLNAIEVISGHRYIAFEEEEANFRKQVAEVYSAKSIFD